MKRKVEWWRPIALKIVFFLAVSAYIVLRNLCRGAPIMGEVSFASPSPVKDAPNALPAFSVLSYDENGHRRIPAAWLERFKKT
jgi:hypothetical protein